MKKKKKINFLSHKNAFTKLHVFKIMTLEAAKFMFEKNIYIYDAKQK